MRTSLIPLRRRLRAILQEQKQTIGYNLAALQHIKRRSEQDRTARFYEEGLEEEEVKAKILEGNKKRKRVKV